MSSNTGFYFPANFDSLFSTFTINIANCVVLVPSSSSLFIKDVAINPGTGSTPLHIFELLC